MSRLEKVTIKITLNKVERDVVFTDGAFDYNNDNVQFRSESIFAVQVGRGVKVHAASLSLACFDSVEQMRKCGYSEKHIVYTNEKNQVFVVNYNVGVRNRTARVVGWADLFAGTNEATKQNYYGSIKAGA
jgi:hypothetical protein